MCFRSGSGFQWLLKAPISTWPCRLTPAGFDPCPGGGGRRRCRHRIRVVSAKRGAALTVILIVILIVTLIVMLIVVLCLYVICYLQNRN